MHKLGLKLWSVNTDNYLREAKKLYNRGIYDYIELYIVPNNEDKLSTWKELNIPYIIHAPHFLHKMNLSLKEYEENNIKIYREVKLYADILKAPKIIFHSGTDGDYKETARQLKNLNEPRALIENKPYKLMPAIKGKAYVGTKFEEIEYIINEVGCGFCFDICHAICAANSHGLDIYKSLEKWVTLNPNLIHLSDKDISTEMDFHLNFGNGTIDFGKVLGILPNNVPITIETPKKSKKNIDDFIEDVNYIRAIQGGIE